MRDCNNTKKRYSALQGNSFASVNTDTAGARTQAQLAVGPARCQLYSLATPNGQKASIMLEELVDLVNLEYNAHRINIMAGEQFTSGFVKVNPNSKIPCVVFDGYRIFESGAIMVHLAETFNVLLPKEPALKAECLSWVFWQMAGQGPMSGNFGHFFRYAPRDKKDVLEYGVARYGMEFRRLLSVMELHLADGRTWFMGDMYTIADIACYPWVANVETGYQATTFLDVTAKRYPHLFAWMDRMRARPAVQRGMNVCGGGQMTKELVRLQKAKI